MINYNCELEVQRDAFRPAVWSALAPAVQYGMTWMVRLS